MQHNGRDWAISDFHFDVQDSMRKILSMNMPNFKYSPRTVMELGALGVF